MGHKQADGKLSYQAVVREKGCFSLSKSFSQKRDTDTWASKMETDLVMGEIVLTITTGLNVRELEDDKSVGSFKRVPSVDGNLI